MFKYEKEEYEIRNEEDKSYYELMFCKVYGIYSPLEFDTVVDFPKKDKLDGVVFKFIGSGAAYFKIQREMPSDEELSDVLELCKFLQESFGEYVVAFIHCEPHIEIRDIDVPVSKNINITYCSSRKNDGDAVIDDLIGKLEGDVEFTIDDHLQKIIVPFMSRKDEDEFQSKYMKLSELYAQKDLKLPSVDKLDSSSMLINRFF